MYRLYLHGPFEKGQSIEFSAPHFHYMRHVLRLPTGAYFLVFNETIGEWVAQLQWCGKRSGVFQLLEQRRPPVQITRKSILFFPLVKAQNLHLIIEKSTELGITALMPCLTHHTQIQHLNTQRLAAISIEACEQSQRLDVPFIGPLRPLEKHLSEWDTTTPLFWGDTQGENPHLWQTLQSLPPTHQIGFAIGPEGGWAPTERLAFQKQSFMHPVTLGPTQLRVETAAVVGVTFITAWHHHKTAS